MRVDKSKWEKVRLGEVCKLQNGFAFKSSLFKQEGLPILRISNIQDGEVKGEMVYFTPNDYKNTFNQYQVNDGEIVIAMSGATTGKVGRNNTGKVLFLNQRVGKFTPSDVMHTTYLYYYLQIQSSESLRIAKGVAQPNIGSEQIKAFSIPLPPLPIQRAIAEELDGIQSMIGKFREQLEDYDRLARSIFHEMFGDPVKNDKGWEVKSLIEIVGKDCPISYGIVQAGDEVPNGIPIVRPVDLTSTFVKREGLKLVSPEISESYKRTVLKGGEILMCVRGTTGIVSIASDELKGCNVTRGIAPLRFESSNKWFMLYCIKTPQINAIIQEYTKGATLKQINMADLRKLVFPLPPLPLQQQFATRIEAIEEMKETTKGQLADLQQLFDSRMQYYFS